MDNVGGGGGGGDAAVGNREEARCSSRWVEGEGSGKREVVGRTDANEGAMHDKVLSI